MTASHEVESEDRHESEGEESQEDLMDLATNRVSGLRMRIIRFTPSWFSVTMGTGICNSLLFLLPWESTHPTFRAIGAAFLILDIALFLFFSFLTIARYTMYPAIFPAMLSHPVHSLFLGTIPMGLVTIVSGIALQGDAYGLPGSVEAAAGLWWVSLVLSGISAFGVPLAMQTTHNHTGESLTAAWLLPIVPPITVAATGSTIASLLTPTQPDYALTIWIASYFMAGVGCLLAAMVLVLYFQRLALHHMPGREVVVTTFLPLGPCGQGGYAILQLGRLARTLFPIISARYPDSTDGLAILADSANGLYAIGISLGLLLWALGIWFLFLALSSLLMHRLRGQISWSLGFWGFTFPLGSLNLLTYSLATSFDSMFFKVVGTIMTASVVLLWACVSVPTVRGWYTGSIFQAPCLVKIPELLQKAGGEKARQTESAQRPGTAP